jgi:integration host factor subunit alpha
MNGSFTRNDLAKELAARLGLTRFDSKQAVSILTNSIIRALKENRRVEFRGFGVLEVVMRKGKIGRNPRKPEEGEYEIPPKRSVKFRVGKKLDKILN